MEAHSLGTASGLVAETRTDPLLNEDQASEYLGGVSVRTLQRWRSERRGPSYVVIGRLVRYRRSQLDRFLQAGERAPAEAS